MFSVPAFSGPPEIPAHLPPLTARTAPAPSTVVIETINGTASRIEILRPDGLRHVPAIGARLPEGSRIQTAEDAALALRFEDGTRVSVGRATRFVIESAKPKAISTELQTGRVRAVVPKTSDPGQSPAQPAHRFLVKTRSITMGVRGTELTIAADPGSALTSVHTLDGLVELAPDPEQLRLAPRYRLEAGEAVDLVGSQGREKPYRFDRAQFLRDFEADAAPRDPPGLLLQGWEWLKQISFRCLAWLKSLV
jgi:hypothetical protein